MELFGEIIAGLFQLIAEFCVWFFLTFLQGLFGCLHPVRDPRLSRLQWLGASLLTLGVAGLVAAIFVGGWFGIAWGAGTFAAAVFAVLIAGAIGGHIENAAREGPIRK